jgi:hypothetical protein
MARPSVGAESDADGKPNLELDGEDQEVGISAQA